MDYYLSTKPLDLLEESKLHLLTQKIYSWITTLAICFAFCPNFHCKNLLIYGSELIQTGRLIERKRVRLWRSRSEVQISAQSNRTQCCQRLATAATFLRKKLCCPGAMTRRWVSPTSYTLRRITASIMKDLIWKLIHVDVLNSMYFTD